MNKGLHNIKLYLYKNDEKPQFFNSVEIRKLNDIYFPWVKAHIYDLEHNKLLTDLSEKGDVSLDTFHWVRSNNRVALQISEHPRL